MIMYYSASKPVQNGLIFWKMSYLYDITDKSIKRYLTFTPKLSYKLDY